MTRARIAVIIFACLFLLFLGHIAFGADGTAPAELGEWRIAVTTVLAGLLGVPLTQLIKRLLPPAIGSMLMTYIAYAAAFIVALIVYAATGGLHQLLTSPLAVLGQGSAVFAIMTLAYKTVQEKVTLNTTRKETAK